MSYYLNSHMATVNRTFSMLGFNISSYEEGPNSVVASLYFKDKAQVDAALAKPGMALLAQDVPNCVL